MNNLFSDFRKNVLNKAFKNEAPARKVSELDNKKRKLRRKIEDINAMDELEKQCDTMRYLDDM